MRRAEPKPICSLAAPKRSHIMLMVALSFSLGIALAPRLQPGSWLWLLAALILPLILLLRGLHLRLLPAALALFFVLGIGMTQQRLHPTAPEEGAVSVSGYVYGSPTLRTSQRMTFVLGDVTLNGKAASNAYCTLYRYGDEPLPALYDGAEIRFDARVYHPQGKSGPYDFDFRIWLFTEGISYGLSGIQNLEMRNTPQSAPWKDVAGRVRVAMENALYRVMGQEARLACAMLLGDREGMTQDEQLAFQQTGIAHIMAVSGLHVGLLCGVLIWLLRKCKVRRWPRMITVCLFLLGYCALTGFSPSSVRAAVMLWLSLLGAAFGRKSDPLLMLGTAMLVVLLLNPLDLFSASFVLSFSAMGGIALLSRPCRQALNKARLPSKLSSALGFSIAAQVGVLLPTAIYFHKLPLYGVLINLAIIPLTGLLVPLYALTLVLSPIPFLSTALGVIAKGASRLLLWLVPLLSKLPYASVSVPSAPFLICVLLLSAAFFLSQYLRAGWQRRLLAMALAGVLTAYGLWLTRPDSLRYIQLDVGAGDAAILIDDDQTIVIDTGEYGTEVAGYLLAENRNIDALYLTHLHLDHIAGVTELLDSDIQIRQVYLPQDAVCQETGLLAREILARLEASAIPVTFLAAGDEMRYNRVSVSVLWPERDKIRPGHKANDFSMAMAISFGDYRILSTGDLGAPYERYAQYDCDVLKVAHHGSADGTGEAFLQCVTPCVALCSCAQSAKGSAALKRLEDAGATVYRTDQSGDLTLTIQDGQLCVSAYRARSDE